MWRKRDPNWSPGPEWTRPELSKRDLIFVLATLALTVVIIVGSTGFSPADQALVDLAAAAIFVAFLAMIPRPSDAPLRRAQFRSEAHLSRIVKLLEESSQPPVEALPPQRSRRRGSVLVLIGFALLVALVRRPSRGP